MSRVRRDIEAMADLLLGAAPAPQRDHVVAMIDGNLPSRGDGWRAAAAQALAGGKPTTFMQSRFGELDLLTLHAQQAQGATFASMVEHAAAGHQWIVSTGSTVDGRMLTGVDEITLLTGVDEAAVVAGYSLLKRLLMERPGALPRVSLILAGTAATDAGHRFVRTARAKLGVEPAIIGCLPEPDSGHHAWHRVALPEGGMCTVLASLVAAANARAAAVNHPPEAAPVVEAPAPPAVNPADVAVEPVAPSEPVMPAAPVPPPVSVKQTPPLPPGLTPLGVTCPDAPGAVFATDEQGLLHVVATAALMADLVAAVSWAARHSAMLPGTGAVFGHILVGDVAAAAALHGGPWPVHLVIDGPQGPVVLPSQDAALSRSPSSSTVPGWSLPAN